MSPFTEEIIKQDIIDHLTWDSSVNSNDVHVSVEGGTVYLKGSVPNYVAKIAAERDACQVEGVIHVESFLEVAFPPAQTLPADHEINNTIENILMWNSKIDSENIHVDTDDNVVTLSGYVGSFWEKHLAADIAVSTNGVLEVKNELVVRPSKTIIDLDIERDIRSAFQRSSLINEKNIGVSVDSGIVHLSGNAVNYPVKLQARDIAMYTAGVVDVVDDIKVSYEEHSK